MPCTWRVRGRYFVAVRGGLFKVSAGREVEVLTREAVASDDLVALERDVLTRFQNSVTDEERAHRGTARLERALFERVADYQELQHSKPSRRLG